MISVNTLRDAALAHARRGWYVFPLWPGTKTPAVPNAWEQRATTDIDLIHHWWSHKSFNIGIAVGPSGLFVIDLDSPKPPRPHSRRDTATSATRATCLVNPVAACRDVADTTNTQPPHGRDVFTAICHHHGQPIPASTYTVATVHNGWQLYYQHPDGSPLRNSKGGTARSLGDNIDTRAHGGYVVAAGSIVDRRQYTVVRDMDPAKLPKWLICLIRSMDTSVSTPRVPTISRVPLQATNRHSSYLRSTMLREINHVRNAPKGQGNAILWGAAVALGQLVAGGELDETLVVETLEQAATENGRRTLAEARATIRSGLQKGTQRPRKVIL